MIEFANLTSRPIRRAAFQTIYLSVMPKNYDLSVVFAPPVLMKKLNKTYRSKNKPANVLSFSLDDGSPDVHGAKSGRRSRSGEIFLNVTEKNLPPLFVHGCLHLQGYGHTTTRDEAVMEKKGREILKKLAMMHFS